MLDVKIIGGMMIDGSGNPAVQADIGVLNGRIALIGDLASEPAARTISARDRVVCPGFVDIHTHSDFSVLLDPRAINHVTQGTTTEVIGNCGKSAWGMVTRPHGGEEDSGRINWKLPASVLKEYDTALEYREAMSSIQCGTNLVPLVGHSTIRSRVMGYDRRPPTEEELNQMQALVDEAMTVGFLGISTGLQYDPGAFSNTRELIELARVVGRHGGLYASHLRSYGEDLLEAVVEAIRIGRDSGTRVQISHMGVTAAHESILPAALAEIDRGIESGIDVAIDVMPYTTVGTWWAPRAVFPLWAYSHPYNLDLVPDWLEGDLGGLHEVLSDPESRARLRVEVEQRRTSPRHGEEELRVFDRWEDIVVIGVRAGGPNEHLEGQSIADIAAGSSREPVDVFFDLVLSEGRDLVAIRHQHTESSLDLLMARKDTIICSDNVSGDPSTPGKMLQFWPLHPRVVSNFPWVFGEFVRRRKVLALEDAIRRVTALPADRVGLSDRGWLEAGAVADIVVFDLATIKGPFDILRPTAKPSGIEFVIVNGQLAVEDGEPTGTLAGRFLFRN